MNTKHLYATGYLGWHFIKRILKRLTFVKAPGLKEFLDFYRQDRLPAMSLEDKQLLREASRCTHCGLCESECAAWINLNQKSVLGPSFLSSLSRSVPDFAGLVAADLSVCEGCRGCEAVCPEQVPLRKIIGYMQTKTEEVWNSKSPKI